MPDGSLIFVLRSIFPNCHDNRAGDPSILLEVLYPWLTGQRRLRIIQNQL